MLSPQMNQVEELRLEQSLLSPLSVRFGLRRG
jgi:hypothetical protein